MNAPDVIENLGIAIAAVSDAAVASSTSLAANRVVLEDMPIIQEQVRRAAETVEELRVLLAGGDRDSVFMLLHRLNNQLTGVLALTLLTKDDLKTDHPSFASFTRMDLAARDAAVLVKQLATSLRLR